MKLAKKVRIWFAGVAFLSLASACTDAPTSVSPVAAVTVDVLTPATVRSLVVEVSGPGLERTVTANVPVGSDSTGRATLTLTAGSARRFLVTALDSAGVQTHRADTTIALRAGANVLAIRLDPLSSSLGVTISFAGNRLIVSDTSTRVIAPVPVQIDATAIDAAGRTVPSDSLRWGTSHPSVVSVSQGRVVGLRLGDATVAVTYGGASVSVRVRVTHVPVPIAVEDVVSTLYRTYHQNIQGSTEGLHVQSKSLSLESFGVVNNFGLYPRAAIPRTAIDNQPGNPVASGNAANWNSLSTLMRRATLMVQSVDSYLARSASLGTPARDARARSFSYFVRGLAIGTLALGYDSVAVVPLDGPAPSLPPLRGAADAAETAIAALDSAEAAIVADGVSGNPEATIPADWLGGTALSTGEYVRLIRSYRARLRSGVARTPAERAGLDWARIAADAAAGIQDDHRIALNPLTGWSSGFDAGYLSQVGGAPWHQVSLMYNGMADVSGAYQVWMSLPLSSRIGMNLLVQTPDTRWPSGTSRAAQVANSTLPLPTGRYIANRDPSNDVPDTSQPWGTSQYDHRRWWAIANNNGVGTYTFMSRQEIAMLEAEALIRIGNAGAAMALVNASRSANGLAAFTDPNGVAPGGSGCVPRLPNGQCGSLFEAMKYEKRMETQLTGYMQWFIDSRGWGDLVQGTALHWPVPFQEMELRGRAPYNMPSAGTLPGAAIGTYGF